MSKKELRMYIELRLVDLEACAQTGAPIYNMDAVNGRINELSTLLLLFGEENEHGVFRVQ